MRVGLLTYGMDRELTGIGRYAAELCYALREVSPQTEVILLNPYPHSQLPLYRDFPTYSVPWLAKLPGVLAIGSVVLGVAARRLKLDILHDPCGIAPFVFPRMGGLRRVVTVHDAIPYVYPHVQPLLTRITFRTLIPASRITADAILTDSLSSREDLIRHVGFHGERITAIYPGTHSPSEHELVAWRSMRDSVLLPLGITKPFFLYVGGLNPRKNIPAIMSAFASLVGQGMDMQLAVVGPKTWMSQGVFDKAQELAESVVLTGYVDEETLHVLYANATAVVYPSLYEGFGLPPLEGMAHGVPVITSNVSSLPEVMGAAGIMIDPHDVDALTLAMKRIVEDSAFAGELARSGRERAKLFSWRSTAEQTLAVYESVLKGKGVPV